MASSYYRHGMGGGYGDRYTGHTTPAYLTGNAAPGDGFRSGRYQVSSSSSEEETLEPLKTSFKTCSGTYHLNTRVSKLVTAVPPTMWPPRLFKVDVLPHTAEEKPKVKHYLLYSRPTQVANGAHSLAIVCLNNKPKQPVVLKDDLTVESHKQEKREQVGILFAFLTVQFELPLKFKYPVTSVTANPTSSNSRQLNVLIGFKSGDILLYEPLEQSQQKQFNKGRSTYSAPVHSLSFIPGHTNLFAVTFTGCGKIYFYNQDLDEETPIKASSAYHKTSFEVFTQTKGGHNPVKEWFVTSAGIKGIAFSPVGKIVAVVSQDGYLRLFDWAKDRMITALKSYYGGLLCVAWSYDGKYIITGGEDDLVTLWQWREEKNDQGDEYFCEVVARGEGHQSWVSSVAFDNSYNVNSVYRFGSVGQDGRLLLWEYDSNPKVKATTTRRDSMGLYIKKVQNDPKSPRLAVSRVSKVNGKNEEQYSMVIVGASMRDQVTQIKPISNHKAHHFPCSSIAFVRGLSKWYTNAYNKDLPVENKTDETATVSNQESKQDGTTQDESTSSTTTTATTTTLSTTTADEALTTITVTGEEEKEDNPMNADQQEDVEASTIVVGVEDSNELVAPATIQSQVDIQDSGEPDVGKEKKNGKQKSKIVGLCSIVTAAWGGDIKYWEYEEVDKIDTLI